MSQVISLYQENVRGIKFENKAIDFPLGQHKAFEVPSLPVITDWNYPLKCFGSTIIWN